MLLFINELKKEKRQTLSTKQKKSNDESNSGERQVQKGTNNGKKHTLPHNNNQRLSIFSRQRCKASNLLLFSHQPFNCLSKQNRRVFLSTRVHPAHALNAYSRARPTIPKISTQPSIPCQCYKINTENTNTVDQKRNTSKVLRTMGLQITCKTPLHNSFLRSYTQHAKRASPVPNHTKATMVRKTKYSYTNVAPCPKHSVTIYTTYTSSERSHMRYYTYLNLIVHGLTCPHLYY